MLADTSPNAFASGLINRPLAMAASAAESAFVIFSSVNSSAIAPRTAARDAKPIRPYVLTDGVATISFHGQAVNRATWISDLFGLAAYDRFTAAVAAAIADREVRGIMLDFDSPGGDVAGATEAAAAVRAFAAQKPIVAFVDSLAASAAYVIAAAASRVIVTPSATVGSIGIVMVHMDRSAAFAKRGVKPTLIHAGAFKVDGHSMSPLPADARKRIEAHLAEAHDLILNSVGRHRPALGATGARKTEAGLFMGHKAVAAGLADAVGTRESAWAYLAGAKASPPPTVSARPLTPPSTFGVQTMSPPATIASPAASAPISISPTNFSSLAAYEAVRRVVRRANANAAAAQQFKGQSVDDLWRKTLGAPAAPSTGAPPAAAQTAEEMWRETISKVNGRARSAVSECYR